VRLAVVLYLVLAGFATVTAHLRASTPRGGRPADREREEGTAREVAARIAPTTPT